jgi:hypothetical protein
MAKRQVIAAAVGALILAWLLTLGHLRYSTWSAFLAHLFLWGGVVLLVVAYQRRDATWGSMGACFTTAAISSFLIFMVSDTARLFRSCEVGNVVVTALLRFHADTGQYPDELRELVPKYLDAVPTLEPEAMRRANFQYERSESEDFRLGFQRAGYERCWRNAHIKWVCSSDT